MKSHFRSSAWLALLILIGLLGGCAPVAPSAPAAVPASGGLKIVASTSWVGALAAAAGATDITVIAPSSVQHPPDYDPKPSDLVAVANADYVLMAGYEGFAQRLQEAVGGDPSKVITVTTEYSPPAIHAEVKHLGELFGTSATADAFLSKFDSEYTRLSDEVKAALGDRKPVVVTHLFMTPWVFFAGLEPAGMYGPAPMTADELKALADKKPEFIFENVHMGGGEPLVEATGAKKIDLVNFPVKGLDLFEVFETNTKTLLAAFGGEAAASASSYPVTIENCGRKLTFEKAPERVVSLWQPQNELLLALGVQKHIVAFAGMYAPLPDDLAEAAKGIPSLGESMDWPSKEVLLSQQPDLIISELMEGFAFDPAQGRATVAELEADGIQVYSASACTIADYPNKRIETVYGDLENLGKIFGVADRAQALISDMKARQAEIVAKVADLPKVRVAFYNGGEGPLNILSGGVWGDTITQANGENVFPNDVFQVSVEEFAAAQPEVIIIGTYPGQEAEPSIAFLQKTFPNVPAVQNNRLYPVPTVETEATTRIIDGFEKIAKAIHPDAFQ
ncbi:MAG: ABC transporter substrate-binding protein [Caldilineaceae bacterium]